MKNVFYFLKKIKNHPRKLFKRTLITLTLLFYLYIFLVFSTSEFISGCGDIVNTLIESDEQDIAKKYSTLIDGGEKRIWLLRKIGCKE